MSNLERKVRAYLQTVASGRRGVAPTLKEVREAVGWDAAPNVFQDAEYVARVRDGGESGIARELAGERAAVYGEDARASTKALADSILAGEPSSSSHQQQDRAAAIASHPAHEILALVAEGRPVPSVERLQGFGLEPATATAVHRAARIVTALHDVPGRNPRLHARELANDVADKHPLPTADPWDGFTIAGDGSGGTGASGGAIMNSSAS